MPKRRKQTTLQVAPTGRVRLDKSARSDRHERSPSPASRARLERAQKAQRSSQQYNRSTWRDDAEQGRVIDEGEPVTSSGDDDEPGLVDSDGLFDDEAEEASGDDESSAGEDEQEAEHVRRRRRRDRRDAHSDSDSDPDPDPDGQRPPPQPKSRETRRVNEIVLSSDDDAATPATPVASTSNAKIPVKGGQPAGKLLPPKRQMLVFDSLDIDLPPRKRRAEPANTKAGSRAGPSAAAKKQSSTTVKEDSDEELTSIALGHPHDTADETDNQPVKRLHNSSPRKRSRVSSSSARSSSPATSLASDASDSEVADDLPVPASIAADNKRLKAKRETALNNAALRSPRKSKSGKVRKVDTKRKLTALSQGVWDRRSEDEESDEEDFVVGDEDAIIYDTSTDEDEQDAGSLIHKKEQKKQSRKGKEPAISEGNGGEEEDAAASSKSKTKKKKEERRKDKWRKQVQKELLATDTEGDQQPTPKASKRKVGGKGKKAGRVVRSETDNDDDDPSPRKKQRQQQQRRRRRRSSEASSELVDDGPEDLEILDEQTVFDQKFRTLKTNESKFASLKAARERRKASQKAIVLDSEDEMPATTQHRSQRVTTGSQPRFLGDPDHNSADSSSESDSDSDGSDSESSSSSDGRSDGRSDGQGSIDDFLAEDDGNDEEVARYRAEMQIKSQGMRWYYKTYIILLVYMIIDPDRDWRGQDDELRTADEKVTQEIEGLLNSLVGSSAWKPKFKRIIDSRPELTVDPLGPDEAGGPCEVCTMGRGRHASSVLTLSGPKYNRTTLQDLASAEDSSAEEESDSEDENAGRKSRDKYYTFNSGGACTARAETYHELRHWARSTRDRVADMLRPLRRKIREVDTDGMNKAERKEARKAVTLLKHKEASRLIRILEDGREVETLADRLQKEINQACSAFTVNK
ncbi:hypothetical protein JCM3774_001690 [Rhodotorula dairenensis]